jgi:hypothetical protein
MSRRVRRARRTCKRERSEKGSVAKLPRSSWIPGSDAPLVFEKRHSCLRLLQNKAFKEERRTKNAVYAIGECMTLESNKSQARLFFRRFRGVSHVTGTLPLFGFGAEYHSYSVANDKTSALTLEAMPDSYHEDRWLPFVE